MPADPMIALMEKIDSSIPKVHTQSLDLSLNELLDMQRNREINIQPDYQRLFRWAPSARSRFIESLLLEMPVPPIYLVEEEEGTYLLIDGLQRISSYLHFRGELDAPHLDPPVKKGEFLVLEDCDIVTELNGLTYNSLSTALQIKTKRAFVRAEIVRKGSDKHFKYHMFKRLNTGGEKLTDQQIRNCTIRMLDSQFIDFILSLSKDVCFTDTIANVTEDQILGAYDVELVLRFFALKNAVAKFKHNIDDFLTEYMEAVVDHREAFDYAVEKDIFVRTFSLLAGLFGDDAFARANPKATALTKSFGIYHFEAITIGIQSIINHPKITDGGFKSDIVKRIIELKLSPAFIELTTGGGKNSPGSLRKRIDAVVGALKI